MKKLITVIAFVFCGNSLFSQIYTPTTPTIYGSNNNRIKSLFVLGVPSKDTTTNTSDTSAQIFYRNVDSAFWGWSQSKGFFKVAKSGDAYSRTEADSIAALKVNLKDSGVVYVTPTKNKLSHTDSSAYHTVGQAGDSSYFTIIRPNGTRDTIKFIGASGGGGSNTASNGLNMAGSDVRLGGALNSNTTVSSSNLYGLGFSGLKYTYADVSADEDRIESYTLSCTPDNENVQLSSSSTSEAVSMKLYLFKDSSYIQRTRGTSVSIQEFPKPVISSSSTVLNYIPLAVNNTNSDSTGNIQLSQLKVTIKSSDPTTTDILDGYSAVYKNSTSGFVYLWANIGGTLLKTQLN